MTHEGGRPGDVRRNAAPEKRPLSRWLLGAAGAWTAVAVVAVLVAAVRSPPAEPGRFGISVGCCIAWVDDELRARELDEIRAVGSSWLRFDVAWSHVERTRGTYEWAEMDAVVDAAQDRGLTVLAVIAYTPEWGRLPPGDDEKHAPADVEAYGDFAARVVERYAPRGVRHYELWNEPNLQKFFRPQPDPEHYTRMIRAAYTRMKDVDDSITVVALASAPVGGYDDPRCDGDASDVVDINALNFLERMYAAGAKGHFDAVSHHPYADPVGPQVFHRCNAWAQLADTSPSLRSLMEDNDDGDKQLWTTEYGSDASIVGEETQATFLRQAFELWESYAWAGPLFWYALKNPEHEGYNLVRADWSRRPAWSEFRRAPQS